MIISNNSKMNLNARAIDDMVLRSKREPILTAWDTFKTNESFGIITITEERKAEIISWYYAILDLDEYAIDNPPEEVKKYLPKESRNDD